jgi:predicted transglutaminase-like cysteine proteinase
MRFWALACLISAVVYCASEGASARDVNMRAGRVFAERQMPLYGSTDAPMGHTQFCSENPADCRPDAYGDVRMTLTSIRWAELERVNGEVNLTIKPVSDQVQYDKVEYWTYPDSGKGDCEDYVLLKVRKLKQLGWPESALLITVVRDENEEGHAVLTVRTDRGDLILDNKNPEIRNWRNTQYTYIKRQSVLDPRRWDSLVPLRAAPPVAAAGTDARK